MCVGKHILLFNLITELFINCRYYFKFKNKGRLILSNIVIICSLYSLLTKVKLLLMLYAIYNYIQIEARLLAIFHYKLPFYFTLFNYLGCIYNTLNIYCSLN